MRKSCYGVIWNGCHDRQHRRFCEYFRSAGKVLERTKFKKLESKIEFQEKVEIIQRFVYASKNLYTADDDEGILHENRPPEVNEQ